MSLLAAVVPIVLGACAAEPAEEEGGSNENAATAGPAAFASDPFAEGGGWKDYPCANACRQRYRIDSRGLAWAETRTIVPGTVSAAVDLLEGPWDWYGGKVEGFVVHPNGHRTYQLWPTGKILGAGVNVYEDMSPPERLADGGARIRISLVPDPSSEDGKGGWAHGAAIVEVHPKQGTGPASIEIFLRFAGVKSTVLPAEFFTKRHLDAEAKALGGFSRALQAHAPSR